MLRHTLLATVIAATALTSIHPYETLYAAPAETGEKRLSQEEAYEILRLRRAGDIDAAWARIDGHPGIEARDVRTLGVHGLLLRDRGETKEADRTVYLFPNYVGRSVEFLTLLGHRSLEQTPPQVARSRLAFKRARRYAAEDHPLIGEIEFGELCAEFTAAATQDVLDKLLAFESRQDELAPGLYAQRVGPLAYQVAAQRLSVGVTDQVTEMLLKDACRLTPDAIDPHVALTSAYISQGRFDEANQIIRDMANRFDGQMEEVLYLRGMLAYTRGEKEKALEAVTDAITVSDGKHARSLALAAALRLERNELDEARWLLDRLQIANPGLPKGAAMFAEYHLKRAEEKGKGEERTFHLDEAAKHCERVYEMEPRNLQNMEQLHEIWTELGEEAKLATLDRAIANEKLLRQRIAEEEARTRKESDEGR